MAFFKSNNDDNTRELMGCAGSIADGGSSRVYGSFNCINARTAVISTRTTFGAGADTKLTVNLYYAPDDSTFDTVPYVSYGVDQTASTEVQESKVLDLPEVGTMAVEVVNNSSDTVTNTQIMITRARWVGVTNVNAGGRGFRR